MHWNIDKRFFSLVEQLQWEVLTSYNFQRRNFLFLAQNFLLFNPRNVLRFDVHNFFTFLAKVRNVAGLGWRLGGVGIAGR